MEKKHQVKLRKIKILVKGFENNNLFNMINEKYIKVL